MAKETPFDRARDFVEEKIDQTREVLGGLDDLSDDVRKKARRLEKDYGYLWEDTRRYVRENPGTALAISLAVGFLVGFLFRGDSD